MEPIIKYEYCDDQCEGDAIHVDNKTKKSVNNEMASEGTPENQHLLPIQSSTTHMTVPPSTFNQTTKLLYKIPTLHQNYNYAPTAAKRSRKEKNILLNPPFYQLLNDINDIGGKGALSVRCCTCGSVVRGSKNVSSNFIKHLRRSHPTVKKMYDTYKIHRFGGKMLKTYMGHENYKISATTATTSNNVSEEDETSLFQNDDTREEEFDSDLSKLDEEAMPNISENGEINDNYKRNNIPLNLLELSKNENTVNLSEKTLQSISHMMDEKLSGFVTKAELKQHLDKISSVQAETESDSIPNQIQVTLKELNDKVNKLQHECQDLRKAMQETEISKWHLQMEVNALERNLNQCKLVIKNLFIADPLQPLESVNNLFKEKLLLSDITIINVTLLPASKLNSDNSNVYKGNILIELKHIQDVKKVFAAAHKLKHTGIYIERESSPLQRKRKEKLLVLRKELLRRKAELSVAVRNTRLIVEGKAFYWDDVRGLCQVITNQTDTLCTSAVDYIKDLTEIDLKEFISVLKNYNIQMR